MAGNEVLLAAEAASSVLDPLNLGINGLTGKSGPEAIQTFLSAVFGDKQHPASIQIVDQSEVAMIFGKRLLANAEMPHRFSLTAQQTTFHRSLLDGMNLILTQPQLLGNGLLAGGLEPIDRESFEESGKAAGWLGPRQFYGSRPCSAHLFRGGSAYKIVLY